MTKRVVLYARVSDPDGQDTESKVSINQQLADQRALCERNGWHIVDEFVDNKNYKAIQNPKRGKIVNPSGERADRPQFLAILEVIKTGEVDIVMCWRDDRIVRHPRVALALEDALDIGDTQRNEKPKIEIRDATGAVTDRFTLSIKATIWREENKRRVERARMGKVGTLKENRWPGMFRALGYISLRDEGKRGRRIEIVEDEAVWVRRICEWFSESVPVSEIRKRLIAEDTPQSKAQSGKRVHAWAHPVIYRIVKAEYYTGKLTWCFQDGKEYVVEIPPIIPRELWEQNQNRIERNKQLSTRNAKGVYLLQGLVFCGDCNMAMSAQGRRWYYRNGERYELQSPQHTYRCPSLLRFPEEPHPKPWSRGGNRLDWEIWRHVVDCGIKRPDLIREQVQARQAELQAQDDSIDGDIAHTRRRLAKVDNERAFYQRQAARGKITEAEFDARMEETKDTRQYLRYELVQLQELRDDAVKVEAS
ncbi:MAG: recombinase family protein, partial [Chloroflexota bacterium]|nr:recombinase family protein [Chloroflexota bacterium]